MKCGEIIPAAQSENRAKHTNARYRQNAECFEVKLRFKVLIVPTHLGLYLKFPVWVTS